MKPFIILFLFLQLFFTIKGDNSSTIVNLLSETLLNPGNSTEQSTDKHALRYGFHKTDKCKDFEKAFLCIRKCLDLNYDVAHSDKSCNCTCYYKKDKAKYTPSGRQTRTNYRLGTPTTRKPLWAQATTDSPDVIYDDNKNETDSHETTKTDEHNSNETVTEAHEENTHAEGEDTPAPEGEETPPPPAEGEEAPAHDGEETPAPEGEDAPAPEGEEAPAPEGEEAPAPEGEEAPAEGAEENPEK